MGMYRDADDQDPDEFAVPRRATEEDELHLEDEHPEPENEALEDGEPNEIREINFEDDPEVDEYLTDDSEIGPRHQHLSYKSDKANSGKKSPLALGKGTKTLGIVAAVVVGLAVLASLFSGGGGDTKTTPEGPTAAELAAANQAEIAQKAQRLFEQRLEIRRQKVLEIRKERRAKAAAEQRREERLAAIKAKKEKEAEEAAAAENIESVPAASPAPVASAPTYTYTPPPAPEPEPAPAPAPAPAPVESQAQVNQSTANASFGFGG